MTASAHPGGNGPGPSGPTFHRIVCACGAKLKVRNAKPGQVCQCPKCQQRHPITDVPSAPPSAQPVAAGGATVDAGKCPICYTRLGSGEEQQTCPHCQQIFHADCWTANLGCSTYGCPGVNVLKKGPDLTIPVAGPGHEPILEVLPVLPPYEGRQGVPWHFVLFALSVVSGLLGLVMCGVPSLLAGAAGLFYTIAASERRQLVWLVPALVLSLLGFLLGVIVSVLLYQ